MRILSALLFLIGLVPAPPVSASNFFVSNAGSNSNSGLSPGAAFATLQQAAGLVRAGDTVFVADGTYAGFDLRDVNGTAAAPIVFKAQGRQALINRPGPRRNDGINIENADYVVVDGFICNDMPGNGNGIRVVLSDHCVVRRCRCDHNAERGIFTAFTDDILIEYNVCANSVDEHGIYVSNSSDRPVIRYNECYGNNNIGIHLNGDLSEGGDGIISEARIYGNIIHDNGQAAGINLDGAQNALIYNNLIYNNHFAQGIALFQEDGAAVSSGARIFNNTIIVPDDGRWGILLRDGAHQNTGIFNNIIINRHAWRGCIATEGINQLHSDYNLLNDKMSADGDGSAVALSAWQALGFDQHSLLAGSLNTLFIDPAQGDYHLPANAPAVNKGTNLVAPVVKDDLEGRSRPQGGAYDIGCYEYAVVTGIASFPSTSLAIYPNPASDVILLTYDGPSPGLDQLELLDLSGRVIRCFPASEQTLPVSGIPAGCYVLRMVGKEGGVEARLVVIR